MTDYWLSWYSDRKAGAFELHTPWWISGYTMDDETILVAAVRADGEEAAWRQVYDSYDDPPGELIRERFIETLPDGHNVFGGRFPQDSWMEWTDTSTCACGSCSK